MKSRPDIFRFQYVAFVLSLIFISVPAFADYTVTGKFQYEDKAFDANGLTGATDFRPIRFAEVHIVASADSSILAKGATDATGSFSITVPGSIAQSIKAQCYATSSSTPGLLLDIRYATSNLSFGTFSYASSNAVNSTGSGSVSVGTVLALASSDAGKAFNIWDVCYDGMEFVTNVAGSFPTQRLTVLWYPSSSFSFAGVGSFYYTGTNRFIYIDVGSAYDDTVIAQQFGHFIADVYSKLDTPIPQVLPVAFFGDGNQDIRLAWSEGLSMFLGATIRKYKGYPNPEQYVLTATDGKTLALSLNLQDLTAYNVSGPYPLKSRTGSTNMLAVAAALWDITNGPVLQRPFSDVWTVLTDYIPKLTTPGITVERFWDGWLAEGLGYPAEMQNIFATVNGIEFFADAQEPDNSADAAPTVPVAPIALKSGARVVINEIDVGSPNAVELFNAGDTAADMTGWTLTASRANQVSVNVTFPAFTLKPGGFAVLYAASGVNLSSRLYSGSKFPWGYGADGACALRNQNGAAVDFVRWGSSTEFPPGGTNFSGSNPATPPEGKTLNRNFAGDDTDSGSDWTAQNASLGTFNPGGSEKHHTFYPAGDVDYAAFNATAGKSYLIETINLGNGADTVLDLIGTDGSTVITTNDDVGFAHASRIDWTASSSGKYYVLARRYTGALNFAQYGSYDLRIVESASTTVGPGGFETLTVSKSGGAGTYQSVSDAVTAAGDGDTVQIADSETYNEAISISGKTLNLKALKGQNPVLSGAGKTSATATLSVTNVKSFSLDGWTISGGPKGIRFSGGDAVITNTAVTGVTGGSGITDPDGIQILNTGTTARIENCSVTDNARLGIIIANGATARIASCRVAGNHQGGIVVTTGNASAKIVNVLMTGNGSSSYDEIQVIGEGTNAAIVNSTIVGSSRSGVAVFTKASARVVNSIIINHTSADVGGDGTATSLVVKNNLMAKASQIGQNGNINGDPKFVNAAGGDYHLQASSPAIDKGDITDPDLPTNDYDGLPRSIDGSGKGTALPDMGAFEYLSLASLTSTSILPQVAVGGDASSAMYRTSIVAVNTGSQTAIVNVSLTRSDGTPLTVDTPDKSASTFNLVLPAGGTARLETGSSGSTLAGFAKFLSNVPVDGSALFKTVNGSSIISEAGVSLSKPANSFTIYIDNTNDALSGYAIANSGTTDANLTLILRDKAGNTAGTLSQPLPAGRHFARFAIQDFAAATAGFEGTIAVTSDVAVAAVALRYDNAKQDVFSTIPVLTDQAAQVLYFPQVADGSGYRTNFILMNPNPRSTSARLEFFDDKGSPLSLPIGGAQKTSYDIQLAANGVARFVTDGTSPGIGVGWVKVSSPDNIGGSAIFQTVANSKITSEAGVGTSPMASHFTTYIDGTGWALSGVAICSPDSSSPTVITLNLRDTAGNVVASTVLTLPALGHVARFFTEWFPNIKGDFEGTLEVIGKKPVSGVALRYDNQLTNVFATLPVIIIP